MSVSRLRTALVLLTAGLGLGACAYDGYGGYGSYGVSAGYGGGYCDPYWDDCYYGNAGYYGDPWYGWYNDYYYPGIGFYVYDRSGRRHRWSDDHRRYWEGRRQRYGDRNWNDRRWENWQGYRNPQWRDRRSGSQDGRWRDGTGRTGSNDRSYRRDWQEGADQMRSGDAATAPRQQSQSRQDYRREWTGRRSSDDRREWTGRRSGDDRREGRSSERRERPE